MFFHFYLLYELSVTYGRRIRSVVHDPRCTRTS